MLEVIKRLLRDCTDDPGLAMNFQNRLQKIESTLQNAPDESDPAADAAANDLIDEINRYRTAAVEPNIAARSELSTVAALADYSIDLDNRSMSATVATDREVERDDSFELDLSMLDLNVESLLQAGDELPSDSDEDSYSDSTDFPEFDPDAFSAEIDLIDYGGTETDEKEVLESPFEVDEKDVLVPSDATAETIDLATDAERLAVLNALIAPDRVQELLDRVKLDAKQCGFNDPMGQADPRHKRSGHPKVKVVRSTNGYSLASAVVSNTEEHSAFVFLAAENFQACGKVKSVNPGVSAIVDYFGAIVAVGSQDAAASWEGKSLRRGVTAETYRQIEIRELEHLVDFDYAFKISGKILADAIDRVASREFEGESAPIDALVEDLESNGSVALIPADPYDENAWLDRLVDVLRVLSGESSQRDTGPDRTHSPGGYRGNVKGDTVTIEPIPKTKSLKTDAIISLAKVSPVYLKRVAAEDWPFEIDEDRELQEDIADIELFDSLKGKATGAFEKYPKGSIVKVKSGQLASNSVWVSRNDKHWGLVYFKVDFQKLK